MENNTEVFLGLHDFLERMRQPSAADIVKPIKSDLNDCESISKVPSLSELENKGAAILIKENEPNKTFRDYPYLFAQAGDLTGHDVEDLLNCYKQLAFDYICLSKGVGVMECIENVKSEESVGSVVPGDDAVSLSRSLQNDPV